MFLFELLLPGFWESVDAKHFDFDVVVGSFFLNAR